MKIVRSRQAFQQSTADHSQRWKVLVVDDEPGIHALTALNLSDFRFSGRELAILNAYSGAEARELLLGHSDIALAIVDVVMETVNAGLELVDFIRNTLRNQRIRLVIRTGQPGVAPERQVIDNYDIDDYKEKTELTAQKLYTTVRCALKGYQDLMRIDATKRGLTHILNAAPELMRYRSLDEFFKGVLTQVLAMCRIGEDALLADLGGGTTAALIAARDRLEEEGRMSFRCGTGRFAQDQAASEEVIYFFTEVMPGDETARPRPGTLYLPLVARGRTVGFIYLDSITNLGCGDWQILFIMANQCAAFLENFWLNQDLRSANQEVVYRLAVASEYKDQETGNHINRIVTYTRRLADALDIDPELAVTYGEASMLHDIGKMGIPDVILQKPARLTGDEFEVIKQHPMIGLRIMGSGRMFELARQIIFCHHERWDGTGYPNGLKGEAIPLPARIVAVADVLDALTSRRPYKEPWPIEEAVEEIVKGRGSHFDPRVVDAMVALYRRNELSPIQTLFPDDGWLP